MPLATPTPTTTPTLLPLPELVGPYLATTIQVGRIVLKSPEWQSFIAGIKALSFLLVIFFAILIVILIIRMNLLGTKIKIAREFIRPASRAQKTKFQKDFEKIKARLKSGQEQEDRWAIIEADGLFEKALKVLGYGGKGFAEIIKNLKPWHVEKVEEVKKAHEIRNRLVHEPGAHVTHFEAEVAIKIYEKALKELGMIE